jgi:hypothetical protein
MTAELAEGLARKLALKPGMTVRLIEAPAGYAGALAMTLPEVALRSATDAGDAPDDAVLAFATTMADLARVAPAAIAAVRYDGLLWIAYPKGGSGVATDLKRDVLPPVLARLAYRPVAQVAVDPMWSALRFRPEAAVGR